MNWTLPVILPIVLPEMLLGRGGWRLQPRLKTGQCLALIRRRESQCLARNYAGYERGAVGLAEIVAGSVADFLPEMLPTLPL